jgi:hypothetical protein
MAQGALLLALVSTKSLQPSPPRTHTVALGWVSAHWCSPLPSADIVPELSGTLAEGSRLLAPLQEKSLLQATQVVLGQKPPSWPPFVSFAHLAPMGWQAVDSGAKLLAFVAQTLLQP